MLSSLFNKDTIVAVATPPGEGGIGILRLSGPKAPEVVEQIWRGKLALPQFSSHRMYFGEFWDPHKDEKLDEGLAVWMKAPRSYTGEEVLELHVHGGPLILNLILEVLTGLGLRPAEPGEFTRRAYLNGKIDLLQAEAVGELIHAQSEAAWRNARGQLEGRLSKEIGVLREQVIGFLARVEAAIDFPEEDIELIDPTRTLSEIRALCAVLDKWMEKFQLGRLLREGVRVALVGRPNVGKSSLLNRLLGEEKAIVHDQPGTTRDVVEGTLHLGGIAFQIFDTAGIREGQGAVEREGILRSKKAAEQADLTLWILDLSQPLNEEDREIGKALNSQTLVVKNKVDLGATWENWPQGWEAIETSMKSGVGLETLQEAILKKSGLSSLQERSHAFLNNARHREALGLAKTSLLRAEQALVGKMPVECVAADLREASLVLGNLLGEVSTEDILDQVFSQFCLGK